MSMYISVCYCHKSLIPRAQSSLIRIKECVPVRPQQPHSEVEMQVNETLQPRFPFEGEEPP